MVSEIHRKKPHGRPKLKPTSRANGRMSVVRSKVEHVFGHQKDHMGLVICTIGLPRAKAAITMANMVLQHGSTAVASQPSCPRLTPTRPADPPYEINVSRQRAHSRVRPNDRWSPFCPKASVMLRLAGMY